MSKINLIVIFFLIFFKLSRAENIETHNIWIVWNIGQGQWVTHSMSDECVHFDVGGEIGTFRFIQSHLKKLCASKKNILFLSHWDFDHYLNITSLVKNYSDICWASMPLVTKPTHAIQKVLDLQIKPCSIEWKLTSKIKNWFPSRGHTTNELSIVSTDEGFLMPGDSPVSQESQWDRQLEITKTRVLILGHHGSRTSSGNDLLRHLPNLKIAVASARFRRYGHPHQETLFRLKKNKTPILRTEDWGSIWFL